MFYDGEEVASDTHKKIRSWTFLAGDGRIVVGRLHTDNHHKYSSVEVDELIYFNNSLSTEEIALFSE